MCLPLQRKTVILFAAVVVVALGMMLAFRLFLPNGGKLRVVIKHDGVVLYDQPLEKNAVVPVKGDWGYNNIIIEDGSVWVSDADCPDRLCIHQGKMDAQNIATRAMGNTIVCLPHRITVTLVEGD
jgi:hypothetical protein